MRVLVAGATGAIGRVLVPRLAAAGHIVGATGRTPQSAQRLAEEAEPLAVDVLDQASIERALERFQPEIVVSQVTAIPARINTRRVERDFAQTNLLRTVGTANIVAAMHGSGAHLITQSVAFVYAPGPVGTVHVEDDPLDVAGVRTSAAIAAGVAEMERTVRGIDGTVLRYGYFYGPGTAFARGGSSAAAAAKRQFPIVGSGAGVWSFIHVDDAAAATVAALDAPAGVYNVVDDNPGRVDEWLPAFAAALGAPAPRRVPTWLARLAAGTYGVNAMTLAQGASNARAREVLAFKPRFADWREGFKDGLG